MKVEFDPNVIAKLDNISNVLTAMGAKADAIIDDFLIEAGKIIQQEVTRNIDTILTKTSPSERARSIAKYGKARDKIKLGEIRDGKKGRYIVTGILGTDNSNQFYLKFAEYGSSKQSATPIFRPAMIAKEAEIEKLFMSKMDKMLADWEKGVK